jgi:DNA-binding MarR family transcriptional regulator
MLETRLQKPQPAPGGPGDEAAGADSVRFTASGAALFRLLEAVEGLQRAAPEGPAEHSRLGILRRLAREGPQTMSQLARSRGGSRQGVQRLARALAREGWVEMRPNPRHRRAPLLVLTARGQAVYRELARREADGLNRLAAGCDPAALHAAARLVRGLAAPR